MPEANLFNILGAVAAVVVLIALGIWITLRRYGYTPAQGLLYLVNFTVNRVMWRTKISGPLPIADGQGAVIICNHRAGIDPLLIQMATDRVVHWMVAKEYWQYPIMAFVFNNLHSIPVGRRGVDTAATKQAIRLAKGGGLVGLFPEGRINLTEDFLLNGRPGAALIALKAQVPVIPCYIAGAPYKGTPLSSFFMRARVRVEFGTPIDLSTYYERGTEKSVLNELTLRFMKEIARLAGRDDHQPELAGKKWCWDDEDEATAAPADSELAAESNGAGDESAEAKASKP